MSTAEHLDTPVAEPPETAGTKIRAHIAALAPTVPVTIKGHHLLVHDLGVDSLLMLELLATLEVAFARPVPTAAVKKLRTVGDLVEFFS